MSELWIELMKYELFKAVCGISVTLVIGGIIVFITWYKEKKK